MAKLTFTALLALFIPLAMAGPASPIALPDLTNWDFFLVVDMRAAKAYLYQKDRPDEPVLECLVAAPKKPFDGKPVFGRVQKIVHKPDWEPTKNTRADLLKKGVELPKVVKYGDKRNAMGEVKFILDFYTPHCIHVRMHGTNKPELIVEGADRKITRNCIRYLNEVILDIAYRIKGERTLFVFKNGRELPPKALAAAI